MMDLKNKKLSQRKQCKLLSLNRSGLYYKPTGESALNLEVMEQIDRTHLKYPTFGVERMCDHLCDSGYKVNKKKVKRLMRKMQITPIYPKPNLSKLGKATYIQPYLLRKLKIEKSNQVWAIDITYIPMKKGFMYLTAIIDIYSRFIIGWELSNSLDKEIQTELVERCITKYGTPVIINSDQGSQYTCPNWLNCLRKHGVQISMDGRKRALDNIYIERFWRTIKYDHIYLNPASTGLELYKGIDNFIKEYHHRKHAGIGKQRPYNMYFNNLTKQLKFA